MVQAVKTPSIKAKELLCAAVQKPCSPLPVTEHENKVLIVKDWAMHSLSLSKAPPYHDPISTRCVGAYRAFISIHPDIKMCFKN